jgi:hypothetical protein
VPSLDDDPSGGVGSVRGDLQALDYDNYVDQMNEASLQDDSVLKGGLHKLTLARIIMTLIIAFVTAMIGYGSGKMLEAMYAQLCYYQPHTNTHNIQCMNMTSIVE